MCVPIKYNSFITFWLMENTETVYTCFFLQEYIQQINMVWV